MSERGIVYILTNAKYENTIKIGSTKDDLKKRIQDLSEESGILFPFECHAAFEIDAYTKIEAIMNTAYRGAAVATDKKTKWKEFFDINPEQARELLAGLADLHNGKEITVKDEELYDEKELELLDKEKKKQGRPWFRFSELGIKTGEILKLIRDNNIVCIALDDGRVQYKGVKSYLSDLTNKILKEHFDYNSPVDGNTYWEFEGKALSAIRNRVESQGDGLNYF